MGTSGAQRGIDLSDVDEYHPQPPVALQRRLLHGTATCWGVVAVVQAFTGRWGLAGLYGAACLVQVVALVVATRRPQATFVRPAGVSLRRGRFRRPIPWDDVAAVMVQGRWAETSRLRLRDGTLLALPGVTPEQAQRLSDALAASSARDQGLRNP